ncbi:SAM-dependent methyltransferase [Paenibacillus sp. SI8]|uniref:SAM-dependent methyltransferase n=1 Tax=unclassified Paenibacillus TaxID=185978 RepID=UPI0034653C4B
MRKLVHEPVPYSQSTLWSIQRDYYESQGIKAWQGGEVPHYITNTPYIAKAYAEVIFGFLRDQARLKKQTLDPIYIMELGGGSGRLAFQILQFLQQLCEQASFEVPGYTYILSDFALKNISFWEANDRLRPFTELGLLDFARFDAEHDREIQLIRSQRTITAHSLSTPLLIIANYFFDTIPQDLFYFSNGQAFECHVITQLAKSSSMPASPVEQFGNLSFDYQLSPVTSFGYKDQRFNAVLEDYRDQLEESYVLFPSVGLQCLERLRALSTEGFLLLSADKGHHRVGNLDHRPIPSLVHHGSISLTVNYHAMISYYGQLGSLCLSTEHTHRHLNIVGVLMLDDAGAYSDTRHAFKQFVESFGPDDFFHVKKFCNQHMKDIEISLFFSLIRLSLYDAHFFKPYIPRLLILLPNCSESEKIDMKHMIHSVWERYYPIGEKYDLAFDLGLLLYQMDDYTDAIAMFNQSISGYGGNYSVFYNIAACYYRIENDLQAEIFLDKCLEIKPTHAEAQALKKRLASSVEH